MRFVIPDIEPMGAVRTTQRQKYKDLAAKRYANYKTYIGFRLREKYKAEPLTGPIEVNVKFIMPIPKSLIKKITPGDPHIKKPDSDNLLKGLFDASNRIIWADDNQVFRVFTEKIYGLHPGIELEVIAHGGNQTKTKATRKKETKQATKRSETD